MDTLFFEINNGTYLINSKAAKIIAITIKIAQADRVKKKMNLNTPKQQRQQIIILGDFTKEQLLLLIFKQKHRNQFYDFNPRLKIYKRVVFSILEDILMEIWKFFVFIQEDN